MSAEFPVCVGDRSCMARVHAVDCVRAHPAERKTLLPYYQDDFVTIYHGRWETVLPDLGEQRFELGFADPPYNVGMAYDGYDDRRDDYERWCWLWWSELEARCGSVVVTPGHGNLPIWWSMRKKPSGVGCWYKPGNAGSSSLGWCEWEPWLYWGKRLGGSDVITATTNPSFKGDIGHPCPKPVKLMQGLIRKTKATTVLDLFLGSGTTLVASKAMGVRAVGIEQSERYCEIAAKRMSQEVLDFGGAA